MPLAKAPLGGEVVVEALGRDRGQQCLHRGQLRVGRALGVGVEQRAARREHVVGEGGSTILAEAMRLAVTALVVR
jgi:hypothetical protein